MRSNFGKILVGIFSYNEGENLRHMYDQIKLQCEELNCEIVLIDDSDERRSLAVVNEIREKDNTKILRGSTRRGKIQGYNFLYDFFLNGDYDVLLHFDADHVLSDSAIFHLVRSVYSGFDVSTCLNKPIKTAHMFQRVLYIMVSPATFKRENGMFDLPLVGHNGAYNKNSVKKIGNIPFGGIDEETYVLSKVLENGLSHTIVKNAICYYALPGTLSDYIENIRRVYGKVKAFNRYININVPNGKNGDASHIIKSIYSRPPLKFIVRSLLSDPIAALFVPFVVVVRWVIMKCARIYTSDTWESIKTTKILNN